MDNFCYKQRSFVVLALKMDQFYSTIFDACTYSYSGLSIGPYQKISLKLSIIKLSTFFACQVQTKINRRKKQRHDCLMFKKLGNFTTKYFYCSTYERQHLEQFYNSLFKTLLHLEKILGLFVDKEQEKR